MVATTNPSVTDSQMVWIYGIWDRISSVIAGSANGLDVLADSQSFVLAESLGMDAKE